MSGLVYFEFVDDGPQGKQEHATGGRNLRVNSEKDEAIKVACLMEMKMNRALYQAKL